MRSSCLLLALALNAASGALVNKGKEESFAACQTKCESEGMKLPCPGSDGVVDKEIEELILGLCGLDAPPVDYKAWKEKESDGGCWEPAWIALTDRDEEGKHEWLTSCAATPLAEPDSYSNWLPNQANNYKNQDCVGWIHGGWGDWYCDGDQAKKVNCFCEAPEPDVVGVETPTTTNSVDEPCFVSCCKGRRNLRFGMDECAECPCPQ